jgi:hypothetical protein
MIRDRKAPCGDPAAKFGGLQGEGCPENQCWEHVDAIGRELKAWGIVS